MTLEKITYISLTVIDICGSILCGFSTHTKILLLMERVFKLISHQQVQQRSVNFMLPLNYNSVFEHRNSHTPNLHSEEKGIVRHIHITVSQERGTCMEVGSCRAHRQRRALFVYHLTAFGRGFLKKFTLAPDQEISLL
jgi:hypothetical protein